MNLKSTKYCIQTGTLKFLFFLGNLLDLDIKGIISKEKHLVLAETSGHSQNSRMIRGFFCWYFTVFIIDTVLSWLTALHTKWFFIVVPMKKRIQRATSIRLVVLWQSLLLISVKQTPHSECCCSTRRSLRIRCFMIMYTINFLIFSPEAVSLVSADLCLC